MGAFEALVLIANSVLAANVDFFAKKIFIFYISIFSAK